MPGDNNYEAIDGDGDGYRDNRDSRSCRDEAKRAAQSSSTWIYVVIFILLLLIFIFIVMIYGKVKGFTKPEAMGRNMAGKPGKVFTGTATAVAAKETEAATD